MAWGANKLLDGSQLPVLINYENDLCETHRMHVVTAPDLCVSNAWKVRRNSNEWNSPPSNSTRIFFSKKIQCVCLQLLIVLFSTRNRERRFVDYLGQQLFFLFLTKIWAKNLDQLYKLGLLSNSGPYGWGPPREASLAGSLEHDGLTSNLK